MRQNTRAVRGTSFQAVTDAFNQFNLSIAHDKELARIFRLGSQGIGNFLSSVDRLQVPPKEPETALPALADHGTEFRQRVAGMNLVEVPIAPRSPWQNAYAERFMGSLRRECLDP